MCCKILVAGSSDGSDITFESGYAAAATGSEGTSVAVTSSQ
jgi:hypothetical protein